MSKIIIPMITPFSDGEIDAHVIRKFVEYATVNGFDGLFPGGSTGGFASLPMKQHEQVLSEVIDESANLLLFAGICRNNIIETIELGRNAIDMGYTNLVIINPYYHKFSEISVEKFFRDAIEALDSNIYLYNNPSLSGFTIQPELVSRLKADYSSLVGMKDSGDNIRTFRKYLEIADLEVFQGKDALLLDSLKSGAAGGVCSTANFSLNTLKIARNSGNAADISAKTGELVELVSRFEVPAIHNYLFRKLILKENRPKSYMNSPFSDLEPYPDLSGFLKYSILPE